MQILAESVVSCKPVALACIYASVSTQCELRHHHSYATWTEAIGHTLQGRQSCTNRASK